VWQLIYCLVPTFVWYNSFVLIMAVIFFVLQKFCQFLRMGGTTESALVKNLEKVESYLKENGSRFMLSDALSRADCYLLPTLQHIRVAGKVW